MLALRWLWEVALNRCESRETQTTAQAAHEMVVREVLALIYWSITEQWESRPITGDPWAAGQTCPGQRGAQTSRSGASKDLSPGGDRAHSSPRQDKAVDATG
jgi:hypothetical protein